MKIKRAPNFLAVALLAALVFITSAHAADQKPNHVGQLYGAMDDVFKFVETFKEFPARSFPPSFVPSPIREQTLESIKSRPGKSHGSGEVGRCCSAVRGERT